MAEHCPAGCGAHVVTMPAECGWFYDHPGTPTVVEVRPKQPAATYPEHTTERCLAFRAANGEGVR